jgi:neutral trehalase
MIAISKNYQDDTYVLDEAIYDSVYAFIHTNLENKTERGKMYQNILVNLQNAKTFNDVKSLYEEALRIGKENDFEIEVENKLKELC